MSLSTLNHRRAADAHQLPGDPSPGEVSVAELQQALKALRDTRSRPSQPPTAPAERSHDGNAEDARCHCSDPSLPSMALDPGWVAVLAAHAGAGASTIALGLLDAMAAAEHRPTLIEISPASRSGLASAADAELGPDPSGQWLRGRRGTARLLRRAPGTSPTTWPGELTHPDALPSSRATSTVVDLGLADGATLHLLAAGPRTVLVARATIPGLRQAEHILTRLAPTHPVLLVTIGDPRRSKPARSSEGRRTRQLRQCGAVLDAVLDRGLEVRGLSSDPLPRSLTRVCAHVLALLDLPRDLTPHQEADGETETDGKDPA